MKIFDDPKNRCGLSIFKKADGRTFADLAMWSHLILQRQMVARCSETAFGCHTFGIGFRVTTFQNWRGGCPTFADVSTFADLGMSVSLDSAKADGRPMFSNGLLVAMLSG